METEVSPMARISYWQKHMRIDMRFIYVIIASLLILSLAIPHTAAQDGGKKFYVYGSHSCGDCQRTLEVLESEFGSGAIVFYDLSDAKNTAYFDEIYSEAFPGKVERIPLIGVFNGTLRAIVSGYHDADFWRSALNTDNGTALYYLDEYTEKEENTEKIARYEGLFTQTIETEGKSDAFMLTGMIVLAALADSINPCAFAVLIAFLSLISYRKGGKEVLSCGMAFILAVFIVYTLMGLGLIGLFHSLPWLKLIVGFAGLVLGTVEILDSVRNRKESSMIPERLRERIGALIRTASNPWGAFLIGLAVSLFLLPCTSGPYFIAMSLISGSSDAGLGIFLLILYNLIFILPFLLITYAIYESKRTTIQTKRWKERYGKYMGLIAGLIIIVLSQYIILEYLGFF